jgi:hypothetical protein
MYLLCCAGQSVPRSQNVLGVNFSYQPLSVARNTRNTSVAIDFLHVAAVFSVPAGQSVPRSQNVLGVTFSYQPPPKSIVPCAASLKELYAPPHSIAK